MVNLQAGKNNTGDVEWSWEKFGGSRGRNYCHSGIIYPWEVEADRSRRRNWYFWIISADIFNIKLWEIYLKDKRENVVL